jgi:folylpolyglutamate synthase/dihydropteroate synthase
MIGTARTLDADAASAYLNGLISYEQSGRLERPTTDRIAALMAALGNPHRSYPVIHATRTNGKGSTTTARHTELTPLPKGHASGGFRGNGL